MKKKLTIKSSLGIRDIHTNKSANTTLSTNRPSSTPLKTKMHTLRDFLSNSLLNLEFIFFNEIESLSVSVNYCFDKAVYFYTVQKLQFSANMFQKVIELDKNCIFAWNNLAVCLIKLNNLNEAIKGFHEVIQRDKTLESSYYNIALSYLLFDKPQEAILCIKSSEPVLPQPSEKFKELERFIQAYSSEKNQKLLSRKTFVRSSTKAPTIIIKKNPIKKSGIFETEVNRSVGFIQSPVNEKSASPIFDEEMIEKMKVKMTKLRQKVYKDIKVMIKKDIPKPGKLESKYIIQEELKELKMEFQKIPEERDFDKIEPIMNKLNFFQKFSRGVKKQIFEIGEIKYFLPGEAVFSQGEKGDSMYVVLKGAISIEKIGSEYGGKKIVINSVYDGRQFGELALLNALNSKTMNNERTASCIACEKTYLFCMPKLNLSEILLISNKRELDEKVEFFSECNFFRGINKNMLIPLASNLEKTIYRLNDVILGKGEAPAGLYLIKKGHVGLYTEGFTVKEKYTDEFSPIRTQKPRPNPMYFSRDPPERLRKNKRPGLLNESIEVNSARLNRKDKQKLESGGRIVKERIGFANLKEFDFFGGRTILQGFTHETTEIEPSKFSIVAQSSTVEIFLITRYHLQFLTQEMGLQFSTILEKSYEVDCPDDVNPGEMDKLFQSWQDYKVQLISNIRKDNYISRHKLNFPFKS
jgi:CRP-like cAMP-binding protein